MSYRSDYGYEIFDALLGFTSPRHMHDYGEVVKNYNYIGKTIAEIAEETGPDFHTGYSIFILQNEEDNVGKEIDTSYSVKAILAEHPEIANYKVKLQNNFFGTTVLRTIKE